MRTVPTETKALEAQALTALYQAQSPVPTHGAFGKKHHIGSQAMVWQYLSGHRPLNLEAATRFALALDVPLAKFSPRLARIAKMANAARVGFDAAEQAMALIAHDHPTSLEQRLAFDWPLPAIDLRRVRDLAPDQRRQLEGAWLIAAKQLGFDVASGTPVTSALPAPAPPPEEFKFRPPEPESKPAKALKRTTRRRSAPKSQTKKS